MVSVLSLSAKLSCLIFLFAAPFIEAASKPADNLQTISIFDAISAAEQRVWLLIPQIHDGELLSALSIADYRGIDARVGTWHGPVSQQSLDIPTVSAKGLRPEFPCQILADQQLFTTSQCNPGSPLQKSLWKAVQGEVASYQRSLAHFHQVFGPIKRKVAAITEHPEQPAAQEPEWHFAPYVYKRKGNAPLQGVQKKLPRQLRWQAHLGE